MIFGSRLLYREKSDRVASAADRDRLRELVEHARAEGGAVIREHGSWVRLWMSYSLDRNQIFPLLLHVSGELERSGGTWLYRKRGDEALRVFLSTETCPRRVVREAENYLALWLCRLAREESGEPLDLGTHPSRSLS